MLDQGAPDAVLAPLPARAGQHASGWWAMWALIATEASLFAYLLFSYFYLASQSHANWLPEQPRLRIALPNTAILLASSAVLYWGERGIRRDRQARLRAGLGASLLLGMVFAALQGLEWRARHITLADSAYASSYFVTTGFHMAHVIVGLLMIAAMLLWAALGKFDARHHAAIAIGALYWHFVDIVWLAVFATFYLQPYLR